MMDIVTKASINDKIYYMDRNKIRIGEIYEILIKVVSIDELDKIIIQYKIINDKNIIESNFQDEKNIHLSKDALMQSLLLELEEII